MKATPAASLEPADASSPTRTISSRGRLSMTNQPRSSSAVETVERPAPDIPVTNKTSVIVRGFPSLAVAHWGRVDRS